MSTVTIRNKYGETHTGTPLECADKMITEANVSRWSRSFSPIPFHWNFEYFCNQYGISFHWDDRGGYIILNPSNPTV